MTYQQRGMCAIVACLAGAAAAAADVVSLQAGRDNTLYQDPTGNFSNALGPGFFVGATAQGRLRRGLIRFDVAGAVPAGSTITGVRLTLHLSRTISGAQDVLLYKLLKDWGEGTSDAGEPGGGGAPATPGDATWIHTFYDTQFWSGPGATSSGSNPDYVGGASATLPVGLTPGFYTWGPTSGTAADVQSWLDDPAHNYGWILIGGEGGSATAKRFDSREIAVVANRPVLEVTYTPPGPTCYVNCDGTTAPPFLNVNDFLCFINAYGAAQALPPAQQITHYANCDGTTSPPVLNVNDFLCFLNRFGIGCSAP